MLVLGVVGHRILAEPAKIRTGVQQGLQRIEETFPGRVLTVLSALAEGADRLVAREVLARAGATLVAVLPFPQADYLTDFESAESKAEFLQLLGRAHEIIELPPQSSRDEAYRSAGNYVADHCDVLMTVWDGQQTQGVGGTGATVAHARQKRMPMVWIRAGNRKPGTQEPTSLGAVEGEVLFENFPGKR